MTSSTSDMWKYFLKHYQHTLYANEKIQYTIPSHYVPEEVDDNDKLCHSESGALMSMCFLDAMFCLGMMTIVLSRFARLM